MFGKLKKHSKIKLYWFRHKYPEFVNFGDELSKEMVEKLSGKQVVWADKGDCEMVAVGSVLQAFLTSKRTNKIVVWGAGLMFEDSSRLIYNKSTTDIRLIRGKLSAQRLGLSQVAYGDPGLLASTLYEPSKITTHKIGLIPHYVDKSSQIVEETATKKDVKVINVYDSPSKVISDVTSCELIISSSLHGVIMAHSFGIPAYWVQLSGNVAGNGFKFKDYYSVFDENPLELDVAKLKSIVKDADTLIDKYVQPKNVESIKEKIISTFPYDLNV